MGIFISQRMVTGFSQKSTISKEVIVAKAVVGIALMVIILKQIHNEFKGVRHDF